MRGRSMCSQMVIKNITVVTAAPVAGGEGFGAVGAERAALCLPPPAHFRVVPQQRDRLMIEVTVC